MNLRRAGVEQRSWAFFLRLLGEILPSWREALWGHICPCLHEYGEVWEVAPGGLQGPSLAYWSRIHTGHLKSAMVGVHRRKQRALWIRPVSPATVSHLTGSFQFAVRTWPTGYPAESASAMRGVHFTHKGTDSSRLGNSPEATSIQTWDENPDSETHDYAMIPRGLSPAPDTNVTILSDDFGLPSIHPPALFKGILSLSDILNYNNLD